MALKRHGDAYKFGTGDMELLSKSTQKRYGSEVEIVKGNGEIHDVIYSGEETTITETRIKDAFSFSADMKLGEGTLQSGGVLTRVSLQASNEDLVRVEQEKLEIKL